MRPQSVTIICVLLITAGGVSLISSLMQMYEPAAIEFISQSPLPIYLQYLLMYAWMFIAIISGLAMLRKHNWGRLLYVGWNIFGYTVGLITSPNKSNMTLGFLLFTIMTLFLFSPKASSFFSIPEKA